MNEEKGLTPIQRRILDHAEHNGEPVEDIAFLHSILAQVGMPRSAQAERVFERTNGNAMMRLEAGSTFHNGKFVPQMLPYGTRPRLVMVHLSTMAVKTNNPAVEVGHTVREFLITLGIEPNGGARGGYTMFRKQMEALAACRLTLGFYDGERDVTINTLPIRRFEAWRHRTPEQEAEWPGVMELSPEYHATLLQHAVPLDHRALAVLKHSAMALDIYTWLAHRLCRIMHPRGTRISWASLRSQFGSEYADPSNFKRAFLVSLGQVKAAYLDARVEIVNGGLLLKPSPPPVQRFAIQNPGLQQAR